MTATEHQAKPVAEPVTERDILHRAADLLEEFGWTQGPYAADAEGHEVEPEDGSARCFCLVGSIRRAASDFAHPFVDPRDAHLYALTHVGQGGAWNESDGRTKAEVIAVLRAAAEKA